MRREFRCCHFRMRVLLEKTIQSKGCTLFQHERVKMVLGALLDLFWIPFGSLLETIWEMFWRLLGFLERSLVARAPSSFSFWPLTRRPKGLRTLYWSVWNPVSSLWSLYTSVWNLRRAIWTPPGAILGPPSTNS